MKTLDEVIKALEENPVPMAYTAKVAVQEEDLFDALSYLKMYRSDQLQWEVDRKGYLDWIDQYKEAREKHQQAVIELKKNPPLTWEELKGMDGKPVWVEALLYKQWAIIAYVGNDHIRFEGANLYAPESRVYMGDDDGWQAYRKERK